MKNILSVLLLGTVLLQGSYSWGATPSSALQRGDDGIREDLSSSSSARPVTAPVFSGSDLSRVAEQTVKTVQVRTGWLPAFLGGTIQEFVPYSEFQRTSTSLHAQVTELTVAAREKGVIETALGASQAQVRISQDEAARLREENARLQDALRRMTLQSDANLGIAQERREELDAVLTERDTARQNILLQERRAERLEKLKEEQSRIIESLRKVEGEYTKLKAEREALDFRLKQQLQAEVGTSDVKEGLEKLIREKREKEQALAQQTEQLRKEQAENETLIRQLQTTQRASDPYLYLYDSITDREVPDSELARRILSTLLRSGKTSLEQFHTGSQENLFKVLIDNTMIRDVVYTRNGIVRGSPNDRYKHRTGFRDLGNEVVELSLEGEPIDYSRLRLSGTDLGKRVDQATRSMISGLRS